MLLVGRQQILLTKYAYAYVTYVTLLRIFQR